MNKSLYSNRNPRFFYSTRLVLLAVLALLAGCSGINTKDHFHGAGSALLVFNPGDSNYQIGVNGKLPVQLKPLDQLKFFLDPGPNSVVLIPEVDLTNEVKAELPILIEFKQDETVYLLSELNALRKTTKEEFYQSQRESTRINEILSILLFPIALPFLMVAALFSGGG